MDTVIDKSPNDQRQGSVSTPPLKQFTQLVMPGFERLGVVPCVVEKAPRPVKARRQKPLRKEEASDAPHPDQLSLPLRVL